MHQLWQKVSGLGVELTAPPDKALQQAGGSGARS
jgi:hypothetical protein